MRFGRGRPRGAAQQRARTGGGHSIPDLVQGMIRELDRRLEEARDGGEQVAGVREAAVPGAPTARGDGRGWMTKGVPTPPEHRSRAVLGRAWHRKRKFSATSKAFGVHPRTSPVQAPLQGREVDASSCVSLLASSTQLRLKQPRSSRTLRPRRKSSSFMPSSRGQDATLGEK